MGTPGKVDQIEDLSAMSRIAILAATAAVLASIIPDCRADERIPGPRSFPTGPQETYEIMPPLQGTTGMLPPTPTTRQNRYEHWQYVGPTRTGEFRPRVLFLPDGDTIWAFDGTHYPWFTTHMNWAVPFFISQ
jgi:hypothetical protein